MSLHHEGPAQGVETLPRIFGRYLLVDRLSQGGMGEIFVARHGMSGFEKLVVIKKVLPHLAADREFLSRFIDEATVAVHLQHANVAQVYEVGRVEDEYFLALEYVAGNDLRATQNALIESGRAMPVELALLIAREAAAGLAYAHRRTDASGAPLDVVHCDISPPNIVLSFEGEVKIIDFGIARSARRLTETNPERGFGKFGYLAPEQLLKGGVVDPRTDTYALGVVLYEMLTGRRMFEVGDSPDYKALARMVVKGMHPLPSQIEKKLAPYDDLIATALKPDPGDRFANAAEFRDAIQRTLVKVNPTINADHLGILIRELFAGTDVDRRRALSEMDKTDLDRWRRELDNQAPSTVSFALAGRASPIHTAEFEPHEPHDRFDVGGPSISVGPDDESSVDEQTAVRLPSVAPPEGIATPPRGLTATPPRGLTATPPRGLTATPPRGLTATPPRGLAAATPPRGLTAATPPRGLTAATPPRGLTAATPPRALSAPPVGAALAGDVDIDTEADSQGIELPILQPRSRGRGVAFVAVLVLLGAVAAGAAYWWQSRGTGRSEDSQVAAGSPAEAAGTRVDTQPPPVVVTELPDTEAPPPAPAPEVTPPPPPAPAPAAKGKVKKRPLPRKPKVKRPEEKKGLGAGEVQGRFRAARREYAGFKERYGARLEAEWNELADRATYAKTPEQLADLDRKIRQFRARMTAESKGRPAEDPKGTPKRPSDGPLEPAIP